MNPDFIEAGSAAVVSASVTDTRDKDSNSGGDPRRGRRDHESAVREMETVLSSRLRSFHRIAFHLLRNMADAEDAVQDALLAAYKHIDQFKGESRMSTWLTSIVCNCARMQLRRRPRQLHLSLDEGTGEQQECCLLETLADRRPSPEAACRNAELDARVKRFAAHLSPSLRTTFQLRVIEDLSISEAATILGTPNGTVKAQLARARKKLRQSMRPTLRTQPQHATPSKV